MGSRYRVENTGRRVEREIERLPRPDRDRVINAIQSLADAPRPYGTKQLSSGVYRLRAGNYRVIYRVVDEERFVIVGRVCRRSERTYRQWHQLFEDPAEYEAESRFSQEVTDV